MGTNRRRRQQVRRKYQRRQESAGDDAHYSSSSGKPSKTRAESLSERDEKRSRFVGYGLAGAIVLACTGGVIYDEVTQHKQCVDTRTNQVAANSYCEHGSSYHGWYYYRGRSGGIGTKATGGSFERGGFGGFFHGGGGG